MERLVRIDFLICFNVALKQIKKGNQFENEIKYIVQLNFTTRNFESC